MSKNTSILIIIGTFLLIVGGLIFFYVSSNNSGNISPTTQATSSPFGDNSGDRTIDKNTQTTDFINKNNNIKKDQLIQLYKNPTSGSVFVTNKNNKTVVKFVDRAVGNIYQYVPGIENGEVTRITNTTIPKIQETVWSSTGENLILRYLDNDTDDIVSFSSKIKLDASSTDRVGEITGSFLSLKNIKQLVISPKGDKIFGLVDKSDKSGTFGFIANLDGSNKKTVLDSPITYWNVAWPKESVITLTTKPNYMDSGLLFFFNPQTSVMERMLGNVIGMSILTNKDANLVAYSYSNNSSLSLDVYDTINKINKNIKIQTLADKCVWGNNNSKILYCAVPKTVSSGNYPDVWYQGLTSFEDDFWKIDTESGKTELVYQIDPSENINVDAFGLTISLDDQYLSFTNKNDLSLWLLKLADSF